ncbi:alkaline phosphatase domain protein, partial [Vibrio parahaemolyticus V-223/04]
SSGTRMTIKVRQITPMSKAPV